MRNYLFTRQLEWIGTVYDDTHTFVYSTPLYQMGRNNVDLGSAVQAQNSGLQDGLPPGWTAEFSYPLEPRTVYILLDKEAVFKFLLAFQGSIVADAFTNNPTFFPMLVNPAETPRKTGWIDPAGIKRKPPPSEDPVSGPQQPNIHFNSLLQFLLTLYALCVQRGCVGYARTINSIIKTGKAENNFTQAQIDSASRAYNACIGAKSN